MPLDRDQVIAEIKRFIELLEDNNIHIEQAVLFGSYAKGTANEWSDVDIALVSDNFSGIRFYDRQKMIPFLRNFNGFIETHPFKPEDFVEESLFAKEILQHGIKVL